MRLIMVKTSFYFTYRNTLINFIVTFFIRFNLKSAILFKYQLHLLLSRFQNFDFHDFLGLTVTEFFIAFLIKINSKTLDHIISKMLTLGRYFTCSLILFCTCRTFWNIPRGYLNYNFTCIG